MSDPRLAGAPDQPDPIPDFAAECATAIAAAMEDSRAHQAEAGTFVNDTGGGHTMSAPALEALA